MKVKITYTDKNSITQKAQPCQCENDIYNKYMGDISPQKINKILIKISLTMLCSAMCLATIFLFLIKNKIDATIKDTLPTNEIIIIASVLFILSIVFIISKCKIIVRYMKYNIKDNKKI